MNRRWTDHESLRHLTKPFAIRPYSLGKFVLTIELVACFCIAARPASDSDYGWHVVNGHHVLDGLIFEGKDLYSWRPTGLWVAHEWLTELMMSLAHWAGGRSLNSILAAASVVGTLALLAVMLRKRSTTWGVVCVTLFLVFAGSLRSLAVRPYVVEMLGVAATSLIIDAYMRRTMRASRLFLIVFTMSMFWANMHGSFPLLCALIAITSLELAVSGDDRWRTLALAATIAALTFVVNPWGYHLYEFALQSIRSKPTLRYVEEWQRPLLTQWVTLPLIAEMIIAGVGIAASYRRRVDSTDATPKAVGAIRAVAFGVLAITSGRHVMIFGIANAALIARGLEATARGLTQSRTGISQRLPLTGAVEAINCLTAFATILIFGTVSWRNVSPAAQTTAIDGQYPVRVLPVLIHDAGPSEKLFNEYRWGGFLIENSNVPVFIDGRSELYGDAMLYQYASIIHLREGWLSRLNDLGVTTVLMPRRSPLATALVREGWIAISADTVGVLLKRHAH